MLTSPLFAYRTSGASTAIVSAPSVLRATSVHEGHEAGADAVAEKSWIWFSPPRARARRFGSAEAGLRAERRDASVPTGRDPASQTMMPPPGRPRQVAVVDVSRNAAAPTRHLGQDARRGNAPDAANIEGRVGPQRHPPPFAVAVEFPTPLPSCGVVRFGGLLLPRLLPPTRYGQRASKRKSPVSGAFLHGPGWNRPNDLGIKSPLLCQLSYRPVVSECRRRVRRAQRAGRTRRAFDVACAAPFALAAQTRQATSVPRSAARRRRSGPTAPAIILPLRIQR